MNYDVHGRYNTNRQIKFKTLMLKSSLCHYSDASILASATITVENTGTGAAPNNRKKHNNKKLCSIY